jgi:hypothetical protein
MVIRKQFNKNVTVVGKRSKLEITVPEGTEELFYIYAVSEDWRVCFYIGEELCELTLSEFCSATGLDEEEVKAYDYYLINFTDLDDGIMAWHDHAMERDPEERRRSEEFANRRRQTIRNAQQVADEPRN